MMNASFALKGFVLKSSIKSMGKQTYHKPILVHKTIEIDYLTVQRVVF